MSIKFERPTDFDLDTNSLSVDWGDGIIEELSEIEFYHQVIHEYTTAGIYDIAITGECGSPSFAGDTRVIDIKQWGKLPYADNWYANFYGCNRLTTVTATDGFPPEYKYFYTVFWECTNLNPPTFADYDVSHVLDMQQLFGYCTSFNVPIGNWDMSSARDLIMMFTNCTSFNQDLSNWNVSNVENFYGLFYNCSSFNQPLNTWNTSKMLYAGYMFYGCSSFNQSLYSWDVTKVTRNNMGYMFRNATAFDQDLSCWSVQHISSAPSDFATNCPINGTTKMPKWGLPPNTGCV